MSELSHQQQQPSKPSAPLNSAENHSTPWQVKWKRPRLDRVVLGFDAYGEHSGDEEQHYERVKESIHDDWVPVSCASVVLTRDEARKALVELDRRDRLLVTKRVRHLEICFVNIFILH